MCRNKDRHIEYIPVDEFDETKLPPECRSPVLMEWLKIMRDLTVKVTATKISSQRVNGCYMDGKFLPPPEKSRRGTGYLRLGNHSLINDGTPCPCCVCVKRKGQEKKMKYLKTELTTSSHVILDSEEVNGAMFECFFDSKRGKNSIKRFHGLKCCNDWGEKGERSVDLTLRFDISVIECVIHDEDLIKKLMTLYHKRQLFFNVYVPSPWALMISHPHGWSKQIAFGKIVCCHIPLKYCSGIPMFPLKISGLVKFRLPRADNSYVDLCEDIRNEENKITAETLSKKVHTRSVIKSILQCCMFFKQEKELTNYSPTPSHSSAVDMVQGKVYSLPLGFTFTVPEHRVLDCYYSHQRQDKDDLWATFAEKTRFSYHDGKDIFFPAKTTFHWKQLNNLPNYYFHNKIYDIPTCKGSSGAPIIHEDRNETSESFATHQCSLIDDNKQSGLHSTIDMAGSKRGSINFIERLKCIGLTFKYSVDFDKSQINDGSGNSVAIN